MSVCVRLRAGVCVCSCVYEHLCVCLPVGACVCKYICARAFVCMRVYVCVCLHFVYVGACVCARA